MYESCAIINIKIKRVKIIPQNSEDLVGLDFTMKLKYSTQYTQLITGQTDKPWLKRSNAELALLLSAVKNNLDYNQVIY